MNDVDDDDNWSYPEDYDDQREPAPLFWCACQNPLTVDTVCTACVAWMRDADAAEPYIHGPPQACRGVGHDCAPACNCGQPHFCSDGHCRPEAESTRPDWTWRRLECES